MNSILDSIRTYFTGENFGDWEKKAQASRQMMPQASDVAYEMSVEFAKRNNMTLQQVLDIQKHPES